MQTNVLYPRLTHNKWVDIFPDGSLALHRVQSKSCQEVPAIQSEQGACWGERVLHRGLTEFITLNSTQRSAYYLLNKFHVRPQSWTSLFSFQTKYRIRMQPCSMFPTSVLFSYPLYSQRILSEWHCIIDTLALEHLFSKFKTFVSQYFIDFVWWKHSFNSYFYYSPPPYTQWHIHVTTWPQNHSS